LFSFCNRANALILQHILILFCFGSIFRGMSHRRQALLHLRDDDRIGRSAIRACN